MEENLAIFKNKFVGYSLKIIDPRNQILVKI